MKTEQINQRLSKLDKEIAALRSEVEQKELLQSKEVVKTITVRVQSWSTFERETLSDKVDFLIQDHSMKFDRKKISVMWEMYRQLRVRLGIE